MFLFLNVHFFFFVRVQHTIQVFLPVNIFVCNDLTVEYVIKFSKTFLPGTRNWKKKKEEKFKLCQKSNHLFSQNYFSGQ